MPELLSNRLSRVFQREIVRFVASSFSNPESSGLYRNRRATRRHHRACPLLVTRLDRGPACDERVILHDITTQGIGFHGETVFPVGSLLGIKLFWSEIDSPRIPAVVRHHRSTRHGILLGAEFVFHHAEACRLIEESGFSWYG